MPSNTRNRTTPSSSNESAESENIEHDLAFGDLKKEQKKLFLLFDKHLKKAVNELENKLAEKNSQLEDMQSEIVNLKKKVMILEDRNDEDDANSRKDTLIISGTELPNASDNENTTEIVTNLMKNKINVILKKTDITSTYRIGRKITSESSDQRKIAIKLSNQEVKHDLLKTCKVVKPKNLYLNESLTRTRATALYGMRQAKKKFPSIVAGAGSYDGRVCVWVKPPKPDTPLAKNTKIFINTRGRFTDFCMNTLKCDPTELVKNWSDE